MIMDLGGAGVAELAVLLGGLLAAGLAMGFLAGLLGIGGGAIVAPVLYELFRWQGVDEVHRMHLAVGTSLAVMVPTTLRSFFAHKARGAVEMPAVRRLGPPVVVGVLIGAFVASYAPGTLLKWIWVVFSFVMSARLMIGLGSWRLGTELPVAGIKAWGIELYAAAVGMVSTLLSIGGGAYITTLLQLYGRPIERAVATSAGIGTMIAIPGALGFIWAGWGTPGMPPLTFGYVNLLGIAALVPTSVLAAPWGVRVAHGIPRRALEVIFAGLLAVVGLRFLTGLIG
jgi:uncharacterized membrane protein YfcA